MQPQDVDHAHIADLRTRLHDLEQQTAAVSDLLATDPLVGLARHVGFGDVLGEADGLTAASTDLEQAAEIALNLGDRFADVRTADSGNTHNQLDGLVQLMASSGADADSIASLASSARASIAVVPSDAPGPIRDAADLITGALNHYGPMLDRYRELDNILPGMLGWNGQRRYLVLAQDPSELRPTGGYIGTVGVVAFTDGDMTDHSFEDVYQLDLRQGVPFVQPPDALANHLLGDASWQLADSNWSPDFPTAAQQALQLYTLESGDSNVDGVIGLTTYALDRLLAVTGPVDVPGYGVTVHSGEVTMIALAQTRGVSTLGTDRKSFLDALANTVIDRLYSMPMSDWTTFIQALSDISDQKLMLAWFRDPAAEQVVAAGPMGGAIRQDSGDYVYVVEANVAPTSKYNLVVQRTDSLAVNLDANGDASSSLDMQWQSQAAAAGEPYATIRSYSTSTTGMYGAYIRVYTPAASVPGQVSGAGVDPIDRAEETSTESGRTDVGAYLLMPPGTSHLSYSWSTPEVATFANGHWSYVLTIQRQPGQAASPAHVSVSLPAGAVIDSVSAGATISGAVVQLATSSKTDIQLQVSYHLP